MVLFVFFPFLEKATVSHAPRAAHAVQQRLRVGRTDSVSMPSGRDILYRLTLRLEKSVESWELLNLESPLSHIDQYLKEVSVS